MNVQPYSQLSFSGYDARPLKGFLMSSNCCGIAEEMKSIGKKENFKIFSLTRPCSGLKFKCSEKLPEENNLVLGIWAQDMWTIVKNKLLANKPGTRTNAIKDFFNLKFDPYQNSNHNTPEFLELSENFRKKNAELSIKKINGEKVNNYRKDERELNKLKAELNEMQDRAHIAGGNLFIVKGDKDDEVLVGARELINFSKDEIKSMYGVDKVISLPQMDYHIDLFIRPLDNKRILLADDELTSEILYSGLEKLETTMKYDSSPSLKETYKKMNYMLSNWEDSQMYISPKLKKQVTSILEKNGYKIIPVPGRFFEANLCEAGAPMLQHYCNYINANVLKKENEELVYITNKSNIDQLLGFTEDVIKKTGFSFEKAFVDSISPYIKKEHIYFVDGSNNFVSKEMLTEYQGGIHCVCTEIPNEI